MIDLKTLTKSAVVGAILAVAPIAANATTVTMVTNGGPYSLDDPNDVYRWDTDNEFADTDTSGQTYYFEFTASNLPQPTEGTITVNVVGDFTGLSMAWSTDSTLDGGDTFLTVSNLTDASFTLPSSPYYLITTYTGRSNGGNIDYRISAVPLPAAGLMLLAGLGGMGLMRRKRKTA